MAAKKKKPEEKGAGAYGSTRSLRGKAEELLARSRKISPTLKGQTAEELIHDLQVHQIELEMQAEELREAQLALGESRDKYLDLYEFAPLGYLTLNDKAQITDVNLTGATLLGIERDEIINHGLGRFITPGDLEEWNRYFTKVRQYVEKQICTLRLKRGDVSVFPARLEGIRIPGSGGAITVRIAFSDITDIWQIEALRESEEKYRLMIENSHDIIYTLTADGVFIFVSPAWTTLLGHPVTQVTGHPFQKFVHPDDIPGCMVFLQSVIGTGQRQEGVEYRVQHTDGTWRWHTSSAVPFNDKAGTIVGFYGIARDITVRKKAEETIQLALAEKEVLLREIHHRVKNNLAGILALIELQISSLSDPAVISLLKDMETRIRSMALVHESLYLTEDLARINVASYTETLTRHLFEVYRTATEVRCTIDMGDVTMSIETAIPCGLVMNEIVTNSLKYAFPDTFSCGEIRGEPSTITLTLHREGSDYLLKIADNGIGIPEGIDVTMAHSLGLFLIRFIVEHQLRGSLEISTTGGTAYTIRFPEPAVKECHSDE